MKFIAYNMVPIISVIGASVLMYSDKSGWGWLIFIAFISGVAPSGKGD